MRLKQWEELPAFMQNEQVRTYYDILKKKKAGLASKRVFDVVVSICLLILLSPLFIVLAAAIACDSKGGVFFRQTRVTAYGRQFRIHKFRTMVANAQEVGAQVTVGNDMRVTRVGKLIRRCRLDELPQLIDVLSGNMTFVGTRPEVEKYVLCYTDEMLATLLLPAGITSEASILYKDECNLLSDAENADETYVNKVLPKKMEYNLYSLKHFGFWFDIKTMFRTVFAVLGKQYTDVLQKAENESKAEQSQVVR